MSKKLLNAAWLNQNAMLLVQWPGTVRSQALCTGVHWNTVPRVNAKEPRATIVATVMTNL